MNLKEIQDGAPEGATHYYTTKEFGLEYLKKKSYFIWYVWKVGHLDWMPLNDIGMNEARDTSKTLYPTQEPKDPTNPSHYKQGKVECIDAIESATVGKKGIEAVLVGNIIKYLWRYEEKNGVEDVEKAKWYLDKLLEKLK